MRLHDDMTRPVFQRVEDVDWVPSPAKGVERKMLYRIGAEVARATSIVRYAPGSRFPTHHHTGGEEILVLEGAFQDEHGDYPAGSYFRNPPGTAHAPAAAEGCIIFVRLWQYREGDRTQISLPPGGGTPMVARAGASAARVLFNDGAERVMIEDWQAGARITLDNSRGLEVLVVAGQIATDEAELPALSWLRLPVGHNLTVRVGDAGARVWIKEAPLQHVNILPIRS